MKNENFITIQGWMVNELGLSGNDLICYALVYGFSQDEESEFSGSLSYVAGCLNITKQNARKVLLRLVEKGLIAKRDEEVTRGIKLCRYSAKVKKDTAVSKEQRGMAKTATDNKEDNIEEEEEKDKSFSNKDDFPSLAAEPPDEYEKPKKKRKVTPKDDALFEECWKEYNNGTKHLAKAIWDKLSQEERELAAKHIKPYTQSRPNKHYRKYFETYLNKKMFYNPVYDEKGHLLYDPEMFTDSEYRPILGDSIFWNEKMGVHIFIGYIDDLHDGYTDENRPNGATLFQNGYTFVWDSTIKKWVKQ